MLIIDKKNKDFKKTLKTILGRGDSDSSKFEPIVREILEAVKTSGDKALLSYTEKFDSVNLKGKLKVTDSEIKSALKEVSKKDKAVMEEAAMRIESFHKNQLQSSWMYLEGNGTVLGQKVSPLNRVGVYVPGGKASYPSTVLMSAIPARVAGVNEVVMATPPNKKGKINPFVLVAASISGVDKIFKMGGAQSIGALAYGTKTIPKVDKIVGPGNIYVATAKKLVFGTVDIDMVAGPSEILIINDGSGRADWIAADLLSQAEHDELASSILITTSTKMAKAVKVEVATQLKKLKRKEIASASINSYGLIITVKTLNEAFKISNNIAPEHLELAVDNAKDYLKKVTNAGAVFLGHYTPEALGDYVAGPNHTLPTGGTARFSSPLGVYDYIKRTSVIGYTEADLKSIAKTTERFAKMEGLDGHAKSVSIRTKGLKK